MSLILQYSMKIAHEKTICKESNGHWVILGVFSWFLDVLCMNEDEIHLVTFRYEFIGLNISK